MRVSLDQFSSELVIEEGANLIQFAYGKAEYATDNETDHRLSLPVYRPIEQHGPLVRLRNKVEELLGIRRNPDDQHAHHQ